MLDFDILPVTKDILSKKGRHAAPRKVIRGIIHKKCPVCGQWLPETEFRMCRTTVDAKHSYCKRCHSLYNAWRKTICRHHKVARLKDIEGFVQPDRGQEMRRYVSDIIKYGGQNNEQK